MSTMVVAGERVVVHTRVAVPSPDEYELLLKVLVTGICGSDLATYRGIHPFKRPPVVVGHEVSGMIVAVGSKVVDFAAGQQVTAAAYAPCWQCATCQKGRVNICESIRNMCTATWPGAFAEYMIVDARMSFRVSPSVTAEQTALVEPMSIGLHAARLGAAQPGSEVLILGAGTIGLASLIGLKAFVPDARVTCVDTSDLKRDLSLSFGADNYVDVRGSQAIPDSTFDVCIIASGDPSTVGVASTSTRAGGTVVVVGNFAAPVHVEMNLPVRHELTYQFSALALPEDFRDVIALIEGGTIDPSPIVTHRFSLLQASCALQMLDTANGAVGKALVYPEH